MTNEQKARLLKFARVCASRMLLTPDGLTQMPDVSLEEACEWLFSDEIVILSGSIIAPKAASEPAVGP